MPDERLDPGGDRAAAAAELQQLLLDTQDVSEFLDELARYAAETIGPAVSCGITLQRDGNPLTVASSNAVARGLDEVQYGHHQGPCLSAMRTGQTVEVPDLACDTRWGSYRLDALAHGIGSALSIPLDAEPPSRGALNLYASTPHAFDDAGHHGHAHALGAEASRALRLAMRLSDEARLRAQLEHAMASRAVIDQAIGIIMGQNRCGAAEAFDLLRSVSNHRNIKLRDIAAELVTRISGPPSEQP